MKVSDPNEEQLSTMSGEKFNLSTINAAICSLFTHQLFGSIYKTCSQSQINILILVLGSNNCVFFRSELSASCTFRSKAYYPAPTHVRWSVGLSVSNTFRFPMCPCFWTLTERPRTTGQSIARSIFSISRRE